MNQFHFKKFAVDLTNKCNSNCEFCARRSGWMGKPQDLSVEVFKKIFNRIYLKTLDQILYNGNVGEPTLSNNIFEITEYVEKTFDKILLWGSTNGSTHNKDWWSEFARRYSFNGRNIMRFAIDGIGETNAIYRRGTKYKKIIQNLEAFIEAGGIAQWQFLLFEHNEHQIEEARRLAKEMGCVEFILLNSREYNKEFRKPKNVPVETKMEMCAKSPENDFYCTALHDKCLYLSHDGIVSPCCDYAIYSQVFINLEKYPAKMYIEYLRSKDAMDMNKSNLNNAINSPFFNYVFQNMDKLPRCIKSCKIYHNNYNDDLMKVERLK